MAEDGRDVTAGRRSRALRRAMAVGLLALAVGRPAAMAANPEPPETLMNSLASVLPVWQQFPFIGAAGTRPIDHFECQMDGGGWSTCTSPWDPDLTPGDHQIAVRAVDVAGLADPTPEPAAFFVDVDGPTGQVVINAGATTTG